LNPVWKLAFLSEALGDLGAALGFSALSLEVARTGEAFWVGLFAALGYFTLGPLLLLSPRLDRGDPVRALLLLALPFPPFLAGGLLYGFAVGVTGVHLRAVRGWLLPEEALAGSLAALRALIYGAGALGGTLSGVLGGIGVTLPLRVALASFLALYLFALGPLHPRRLEEVEAMGRAS
jgi:hypothetical protein